MIFPRVPFPQHDGGAVAMFNLIKGLASCEGIRLHLFFLNTTKHYVEPAVVKQEFQQYGTITTVEINNTVTIRGAVQNLFSRESYFISRFIKENVATRLRALLKQETFDLVHVDGLQVANYVDLIRAYTPQKTKIVLRQHNVEHLIWERLVEDVSRVKRTYLKWQTQRLKNFELAFIHKFDALLPISEVDEAFFREEGVQELQVLPAGVMLKEGTLPVSAEKKDEFYHLGSMDWQPNCDSLDWFLSEIWPQIYHEFQDVRFHVAGKNMPDYFCKYDGKLGVKIHGEVADADQFIADYGCQIVPLRSGSGLRVKILQAFSHAKAVITTSIGCEGIAVSNKKEVLVANTAAEFIAAIAYLKTDRLAMETMGKAAYDFVQREYSIKRVSERLVKYYEYLLDKS